MIDIHRLRICAVIFAAICAAVLLGVASRPAAASAPHPERTAAIAKVAPPRQSPTPPPPPPPPGDGNPITQIVNQIIQFPFENLVEALQNAAKSILSGTVTPLESFFSASIGRWLTSSPGIITPGGGIAQGDDVMGPAWLLMVKVAVLLWPLTLAIIAAIAAKDAVAAASWGIGDLKEALGGWLIAVVASATSLYWMDLANRFSNATTLAILNMSFTGEAGFQPNAITTLVFGTAGIVLTMVAMPASLIIVVFVILMGLAVLSALIFQFLARFVILYILVALAPVVIILGVLPPLGWFRYMWMRGFVLVEALGPINALLLKLVMVLAVRGPSNDPITAFVNFIGAIGVLSVLLTVDGIIIRGVFGAAGEVMQKAVSTVTTLGTLALAGVTALAGGSIAAGAVSASGTTAAGGSGTGGGTGGGGNGLAASSSATAANSAARASATGTGSPANVARNAFNSGAALRGAGDVLFRQPGMLGSLGAGMRSLGGTMERPRSDADSQARWGTNPAGRGSTLDGRGASDDNAPRRNEGSSAPKPSPVTGNRAPTSQAAQPPSADPNAPVGAVDPTSARISSPVPKSQIVASTATGSPRADVPPNVAGNADRNTPHAASPVESSLPPAQTPSVSPMGAPLMSPSLPTSPTPPSQLLAPEAASEIGTLPSPLADRTSAFASLYSDPGQQVAAARASVDAFNQVSIGGHGSNDPASQASSWDRSMTPVIASARQGLPLETMAHDAGFGGNVAGFLAHRMVEPREPTLEVPAQQVPWHPQLAPHDWDMGAAVSNSLGHRITPGAAARIYHEIRSPETGGGWSAGAQFIQTVQDIFHQPPSDPIAALEARLSEMQAQGVLSQRAMTLWRANAKNRS